MSDGAHLKSSTGQLFPVLSRPQVIGRSDECDIVVSDSLASARHAHFFLRDGVTFVKDLNSTNGTFVDGAWVRAAYLRDGSSLRVGRSDFSCVHSSMERDLQRIEPRTGTEYDVDYGSLRKAVEQDTAGPSKSDRLVLLDCWEAVVRLVPRGWPERDVKWVLQQLPGSELTPGDIYRLREARNRAAHAALAEAEGVDFPLAAAIARKLVTQLRSRGLTVEVFDDDSKP